MAAQKTVIQAIIIVAGLAIMPIVLLSHQRERAAKFKAEQVAAEKAAAVTAAQATTPNAAAAAPAATTAPKPGGVVEVKLGPRDEKAIALQKADLAREWGRDPFYSAAAAVTGLTAKAGTLTLKGIAYRPSGKSYAMVNEAILREGEEIEGNQIVKIEKRQITLSREGREFILRLEEESP